MFLSISENCVFCQFIDLRKIECILITSGKMCFDHFREKCVLIISGKCVLICSGKCVFWSVPVNVFFDRFRKMCVFCAFWSSGNCVFFDQFRKIMFFDNQFRKIVFFGNESGQNKLSTKTKSPKCQNLHLMLAPFGDSVTT